MVDLHDVLERERLEVEAVRRVVVGRDGLRVAVDHDGLVAGLGQGQGGVHARVVELDALADPVGTGAQDDDLLPLRLRRDLRLGGGVELVGGVVVRGLGLELGRAGVDGLVDGAHPQAVPKALHALGPGELGAQRRDLGVGQPVVLGATQQGLVDDRGVDDLLTQLDQRGDLVDEPRVDARGLVHLLDRGAQAQRELDVVHASLGRATQIVEDRRDVGRTPRGDDLVGQGPEAGGLGLERAHDLAERLAVVAAEAHGLAHRLHRGGEGVVGTRELLERETRGLDDDVVEGRLEARRGLPRDVVGDLVERVADREAGRDLGDREAGGLGGQRRRA